MDAAAAEMGLTSKETVQMIYGILDSKQNVINAPSWFGFNIMSLETVRFGPRSGSG